MKGGIRVLSANLKARSLNLDPFLDLIVKEQVDLLCAQELNRWVAGAVSEVLPEGNLRYPGLYRGVGIGARRAIDCHNFGLPERPGRIASLSPAVWPDLPVPLWIANVHILGPHVWPVVGNSRFRKTQTDRLLSELNDLGDVSLALFGDFNAGPGWRIYRRLANRFDDAALRHSKEMGPTWPHLRSMNLQGLIRIDHCFVQKVSTLGWRRIEIPGSDHLGLLVDVRPS